MTTHNPQLTVNHPQFTVHNRPKGMPILWARASGPVHGPYAEAWFDEIDLVHRVRLTAEGRRKVADYLNRYPQPINLLISSWPGLFRAARAAKLTSEEINALCLEGVAQAFVRFDPRRGAAIGTAIAWGVRASVGEAVKRARRAASLHSAASMSLDNRATALGVNASARIETLTTAAIAARGLQPTANDERTVQAEQIEEVNHHLTRSNLTKNERSVLVFHFGLAGTIPRENAAIAQSLGISVERVRQIHEKAIRKIRTAIGLDVDWAYAARSRILAYLAKVEFRWIRNSEFGAASTGAATSSSLARRTTTKSEICKRADVPLWQLRAVLPRLLKEGLVCRERKLVSHERWSLVFRICTGGERSAVLPMGRVRIYRSVPVTGST